MRGWYSGCALAFQASDTGSIPVPRSIWSHMVEFSDTLVYLITLVLPAIFVVVQKIGDIAFNWLKTKTPFYFLVPEDKVREALENAIYFGVNFAVQKARESGALTVKADNKLIITALEYVKESVPQGLARFGITDERLADMVRARVADLKL